MPWKTSSVMEEKLRFVFEHELQERTMTELCDRYEITRQTGYMWLRRYREAGAASLLEHSRATQEARAHRPVQRAASACGRTESRVVRGFQGLVPHRRWRAHRSADHLRRAQPVSVTRPGRREDRHGQSAGHF